MSSSSWGLLPEKEEQELFKRRLLNIEEKPFKRVTKRLLTLNKLVYTYLLGPAPDEQQQQQPPQPDASAAEDTEATIREIRQLQEDLALDFEGFRFYIIRLELLDRANESDRQLYALKTTDKNRQCDEVRRLNALLREQLEDARAQLAQRKKFDELAEKITNNKLLRPRQEQRASLAKLEEECRELERESETYAATWRERRDQFARIMDEGMMLRRQIRDEKEEVDRREGMNEDEAEEDGEASRGGQTPRHVPSGNATPAVESGMASRGERELDGSGTPAPTHGSRTPRAESPHGDMQDNGTDSQDTMSNTQDTLRLRSGHLGSRSQLGSTAGSRAATPQLSSAREEPEEGEDVDMGDEARPDENGTPQIMIDAADERMDVDS